MTMPIQPESEIPELTAAEISAAQSAFIADVERELRIAGDHNPESVKLLHNARERITVTPRLWGPEVRYKKVDGGLATAALAAKSLGEQANERMAFLAHGPDPVALVSERLQSVGISKADADMHARRGITRLDDGRVATIGDSGEPFTLVAPWQNERPMTEEERLTFKDHARAVTKATRDALARIEHEKLHPKTAPLNDRGDRVRRMIVREL